jgi:hypothetical protein
LSFVSTVTAMAAERGVMSMSGLSFAGAARTGESARLTPSTVNDNERYIL